MTPDERDLWMEMRRMLIGQQRATNRMIRSIERVLDIPTLDGHGPNPDIAPAAPRVNGSPGLIRTGGG